jgi:2-polyprenyl-6-methoxyphenol hydroxylase-like FAD-dependent oxidoreductase
MNEIEVLVVGAGPTGLTLAIDLAHRGVRTLLVERHERPLALPKMERTNPRSMEIFRRLGVADRLRAAAYPATGASLDVLDIHDPQLKAIYERDLVLARPDMHVCWRGDSAPSNFAQIAATVTGWGTAPC